MKVILLLLLLPSCVVGQTTVAGPYTFTGPVKPQTGTIAGKPATCVQGQIYFATDVSTAGQNLELCTATNTWTQMSGGGSPAGSSGQIQYNSSGSFAGLAGPATTNALTVSGSIVGTGTLNMPIAGMSCGKVVLGFASLTGGSQAQEIPLFAVPADFHIDMLRMNPATLYVWASGGTTMTVSIQQQGNTSAPDIMPATNIMSAGVFLDDIPANPNLSSHTISLNMAGNANFSNLNAGSLQVTYCGHVVL